MTVTIRQWWLGTRGLLTMYVLIFAMAVLTTPSPATPAYWKVGLALAAAAAFAGVVGSWRVVAGISRGRIASMLEQAGVWGIVVFEGFHAIVAALYALELTGIVPPLDWGRALAHGALAFAVCVAQRRRPVVRKVGRK